LLRRTSFALAGFALLLPVPAWAQAFNVGYVAPDSYTVMGDAVGVISAQVTNTHPTTAINVVTFKFGGDCDAGNFYDIDRSPLPPPGWTVTAVSAKSLTFTASAGSEIAAGSSQTFRIFLVGDGAQPIPAAASDRLDAFDSVEATLVSGAKMTRKCKDGQPP
jgi:hypothetical protein